MVMYASISRRHLIEHFQDSLLCGVLSSCWMEGRHATRSFMQVAVIPFALGFVILTSNICLGRSTACMLIIEFMKASCLDSCVVPKSAVCSFVGDNSDYRYHWKTYNVRIQNPYTYTWIASLHKATSGDVGSRYWTH